MLAVATLRGTSLDCQSLVGGPTDSWLRPSSRVAWSAADASGDTRLGVLERRIPPELIHVPRRLRMGPGVSHRDVSCRRATCF